MLDSLIKNGLLISRGAESDLYLTTYLGYKCVLKYRRRKAYRNPILDEKIQVKRTYKEALILRKLRKSGLSVPRPMYVNVHEGYFLMEYIDGDLLRDLLLERKLSTSMIVYISRELGKEVALMHNSGISHGDLTTSNMLLDRFNNKLYLIDFGLGLLDADIEEKAIDIEIFYRVLKATHTEVMKLIFSNFIHTYVKNSADGERVISRCKELLKMGRYVERR
ncbi:MAG: Kae1-associated kinase Bud32 [Candidatus Geothermarchaeota archaeon]